MVHGRLVEKEPDCYRIRPRDGRVMPTVTPLLISRIGMTRDTRTRHCRLDISDSTVKLATGQSLEETPPQLPCSEIVIASGLPTVPDHITSSI